MTNPKFYGFRTDAGAIEYEKPDLVAAYLRRFKPNQRLEIVIKKYIRKRSNPQNAYYWGVVINLISKETGQDKDSVHDGLRQMFLKENHETLPTVKSTTKLSTVEFQRYIDQCVLWAAEFLGVIIPEPFAVEY